MALILTTPIASLTSSGPISDVISAGTSKVVDSVKIINYHSFKWILHITNLIENTKLTQEILVTHNSLTKSTKYSRYNLLGDMIPHLIEVLYNEDDIPTVTLQITNVSIEHEYFIEISHHLS